MLTLAALTFVLSARTQTHQDSTLDFTKTWSSVERAISTTFYARKTRKEDMDRLLADTKPLAEAAKSSDEFQRVVNGMIDRFKDSHFAFYTSDSQGYYVMQNLLNQKGEEDMPEIGAWFKPSPDGYTVQMVLNGSAAESAGIRKGDDVIQADGAPFSPIASLKPAVGKDVILTFVRAGRTQTASVHVSREPALDMFLNASRDSSRVIEDHGRKIGYFHLWTLAAPEFQTALSGAVYGKLRDTDAFILDLRDGFGGRPEGYADPFFRPGAKLEWITASGTDTHELFGYQKPLIVLINGGSRSAKEVLADILKTSKRATLVGSTTAGNVLGTSPRRINDWSFLEVPMVEVKVDGQVLEGIGVSPNVTLPEEFDANGNDLYLEKALDMLKSVPIQH